MIHQLLNPLPLIFKQYFVLCQLFLKLLITLISLYWMLTYGFGWSISWKWRSWTVKCIGNQTHLIFIFITVWTFRAFSKHRTIKIFTQRFVFYRSYTIYNELAKSGFIKALRYFTCQYILRRHKLKSIDIDSSTNILSSQLIDKRNKKLNKLKNWIKINKLEVNHFYINKMLLLIYLEI